MSDQIIIDGSQGEGGGQILRSALGLSMLTGRPFRIQKIRANRPKPGLMRQHLTAVNAAAEVCSAKLTGAAMGSRELTFEPGPVKAGDYTFSVGSAGSTTLVLQTVLPPLMVADAPSTLTLEGGTHNIHAPPLDFLEHAFLPVLNRMGPQVTVALERAGFYPAGGGRFFAMIEPSPKLSPIRIDQRGEITRRLARAMCAGLPGDIALRELDVVRQQLGWPDEALQVRQLPEDQGPGNIVTLQISSENVTEVFTGFGERGTRAEAVAHNAVQEARKYLAAGVPVGPHLADQLLIPFAMAGGGSFVTTDPTPHTMTNIDVIRMFLETKLTCTAIAKPVSDNGRVNFWPSSRRGNFEYKNRRTGFSDTAQRRRIMPMRWVWIVMLLAGASAAFAAEVPASIPLWPNGAPGSEGKTGAEVGKPEGPVRGFTSLTNVHNPSIIPYLPPKEKATGVAVIVLPGGGHRNLAIGHEGYNVGEWLADHGIAAFVVKYRLAREPGSTYRIDVEALADTQRAIRTVRSRAKEWNVNPEAVGVMGFSAGGELASLASIRMDGGIETSADPIDRQSAKPNFQALIYPGQSGKIVPLKDSPPAFLACGNLDRPDISEGLASVYLLFKKVGVSAELHIYAKTGHGFGLRPTDQSAAAQWPVQFQAWLVNLGFQAK